MPYNIIHADDVKGEMIQTFMKIDIEFDFSCAEISIKSFQNWTFFCTHTLNPEIGYFFQGPLVTGVKHKVHHVQLVMFQTNGCPKNFIVGFTLTFVALIQDQKKELKRVSTIFIIKKHENFICQCMYHRNSQLKGGKGRSALKTVSKCILLVHRETQLDFRHYFI